MRGKEVDAFGFSCGHGITPAYAGKSFRFVHFAGFPVGSPPRMRGKATNIHIVTVMQGITPAYAGKSLAVFPTRPGERDHPRVCGEKARCGGCWRLLPGSPPRMRGKEAQWWLLSWPLGITPAYAGKRVAEIYQAVQSPGSPPRMRGKD